MNKLFPFILLAVLFLSLRLTQITKLPIFADEAIYLRWASMIYHDPQQFLFLPLYDGKTPLFIWSLIPITQFFSSDPLWGGRVLVVFFGLLLGFVLTKITKQAGGSARSQVLTFLLYAILPFTFFFDRMSLIDVPLTLMLALSYLSGMKWVTSHTWKNALLTGFFWGLAVLTKTSALYALPIFLWIGLRGVRNSKTTPVRSIIQFGSGGALGLGMLLLLRYSPLFPFLFNRSSDFAYGIEEIFRLPFSILAANLPRVFEWLWHYLTPAFWITSFLSLAYGLIKRKATFLPIELMAMGILFVAPFIFTGKLLTSRYFLPSVIWFIPSFGLLIDYWLKKKPLMGSLVLASVAAWSFSFILPLYTDLGRTRLTTSDKGQYLAEWSAGFGIPEIRDIFRDTVNGGETLFVATEGYFGTLPDGLFVYFSETPELASMEIVGVGQPLLSTPSILFEKSGAYDAVFLVANQNRINYDYSADLELVQSFEKPENGSPLLLLRLRNR
jgi:hypothetical protein